MAKALQTWSPFRELERFQRDFDEMFVRVFGVGASSPSFLAGTSAPPLETYVEGDKMIIRADLPGIDPNDVEVTVTGSTLTLRASRQRRAGDKDREFMHREVSYGGIERSLPLPAGVKPEDVKASYRNGVLELTVQMPREMAPRKVPIEVEGGTAKRLGKNE